MRSGERYCIILDIYWKGVGSHQTQRYTERIPTPPPSPVTSAPEVTVSEAATFGLISLQGS